VNNQENIFKQKELWEEEWEGMPEFIQKDLQPIQKIVVNFLTREDVEAFAKITGHRLTNKTKSVWFPARERDKPAKYCYYDSGE